MKAFIYILLSKRNTAEEFRMNSIACWFIVFGALNMLETIKPNHLFDASFSTHEEIDEHYWELVKWFYGDRGRISVHLIVPTDAENWHFRWTNTILKHMTQRK